MDRDTEIRNAKARRLLDDADTGIRIMAGFWLGRSTVSIGDHEFEGATQVAYSAPRPRMVSPMKDDDPGSTFAPVIELEVLQLRSGRVLVLSKADAATLDAIADWLDRWT